MTAVQAVPTHTFTDGSGFKLAMGVSIGHTKGGAVTSLSDWDAVEDLLRAGVITRESWTGDGAEGHDMFRLAD